LIGVAVECPVFRTKVINSATVRTTAAMIDRRSRRTRARCDAGSPITALRVAP
jgi:hypothetical protein